MLVGSTQVHSKLVGGHPTPRLSVSQKFRRRHDKSKQDTHVVGDRSDPGHSIRQEKKSSKEFQKLCDES